MSKEPLQFQYTVDVDEGRIADGIALAKEMMADAMKNLALYSNGCSGCLLAMFGAVADLTVEEARAGWGKEGVGSFLWLFEDVTPEERALRKERHLERMAGAKRALLFEAQKRGAKIHVHGNE